MKVSTLMGERQKEMPQGVVAKSHELLLRGGFIKQVSNGSYSLFPPAMRVQKKIADIIRDEMDKVDGQEVLFPVMMPRELWEESGRYYQIGNEMFRLKDRTGHDMVLGMTHEEAAVHMAKNTIKSYDQLPSMIYQIQTKLRDEARARAGLLRVKEFTMKDAYSFHESYEDLNEYYNKMYVAYQNIFKRIGLKNVIAVQSDSGMMGGSKTHEFMLLTDIGEDTLAVCSNCDYSANLEIATSIIPKFESFETEKELVFTPNTETIEALEKLFNLESHLFSKAVVYYGAKSQRYYVVFIRADLDVNQTKLENLAGEELVLTDDLSDSNLVKGFIGPNFTQEANVEVYYDISLQGEKNLIVGANQKNHHIKGFSFERDVANIAFYQLYEVKQGHNCEHCQTGVLELKKGIEIGHIFALGTKYTESMNMTIHNRDGKLINPIMGCYGIGLGRAIASIIEENNDEKGIIWPVSVAPWQVYLAPIKNDLEEVRQEAEKVYEILNQAGFEVLYDDRKTSPGVKFAESELMGIPVRIVISPRTMENNVYEVAIRQSGEKINLQTEELVSKLNELLK